MKIVVVAAGLLATLLGWFVAPGTALGSEVRGDAALAGQVRAAMAGTEGYHRLSVALVEPGGVRFAAIGGADPRDAYEIGSIGKALTGMLLADLARDGTVRVDEPLRALLPGVRFDDPALGGTGLDALAGHRAGLPSVRITSATQAMRTNLAALRGTDPYAGQDRDRLLESAGSAKVSGAGEFSYSNFGMALLGQALAERAGTPYPALVRERILQPLGMTETRYHLDGADIRRPHAQGHTADGRPVDPWQASGYAPAGVGVWSTTGDLATLVSALLAGGAPGADAATPRTAADDGDRIGYGWFTDEQGVTWHNGGTGGFSSYVGYDRAAGRGIVLLSDTTQSVTALGRVLLAGEGQAPGDESPGIARIAATLFLTFAGGIGLVLTAWRRPDRLGLVSGAGWAVAAPIVALSTGAWLAVPGVVWALGVGVSAAALTFAVARSRAAPLVRARWPWMRWTSTVLSLLLAAGAVALFA